MSAIGNSISSYNINSNSFYSAIIIGTLISHNNNYGNINLIKFISGNSNLSSLVSGNIILLGLTTPAEQALLSTMLLSNPDATVNALKESLVTSVSKNNIF